MEILELCEAARRELHADETLVNLPRYIQPPPIQRARARAGRARTARMLQRLPGARFVLLVCLKVRVRSPVKIFGDIHGQLADLIKLFRVYGCAPRVLACGPLSTHKVNSWRTVSSSFACAGVCLRRERG